MKLEEYLNEHKISVAAFAKEIGCSRQWIYDLINRRRKPSAESIKTICDATNGLVTANELCGIKQNINGEIQNVSAA